METFKKDPCIRHILTLVSGMSQLSKLFSVPMPKIVILSQKTSQLMAPARKLLPS